MAVPNIRLRQPHNAGKKKQPARNGIARNTYAEVEMRNFTAHIKGMALLSHNPVGTGVPKILETADSARC
jgi:hypothetical protein